MICREFFGMVGVGSSPDVGGPIGNVGDGQTAEDHLRETAEMVKALVVDSESDNPIVLVADKMVREIDGGDVEKGEKKDGKWNKSMAWFATNLGPEFHKNALNLLSSLDTILGSSMADVNPAISWIPAGIFLALEGAAMAKSKEETGSRLKWLSQEQVLGEKLVLPRFLYLEMLTVGGVAGIVSRVAGLFESKDVFGMSLLSVLVRTGMYLGLGKTLRLLGEDAKEKDAYEKAFKKGFEFGLGASMVGQAGLVFAKDVHLDSLFDKQRNDHPDGNVASTSTAPEPTHTQVASQPTETSVQPESATPSATPMPTNTPPPTTIHAPATETSQPTAIATAMATATEAITSIFPDLFLDKHKGLKEIMDKINDPEQGFSGLNSDQRVALIDAARDVDHSWQYLGGGLTGCDVNGDGVLDVFNIDGEDGYNLMPDGKGNLVAWDGVSNGDVWRTLEEIRSDWPEIDIGKLQAADAAIAAEGDK